MTPEEKRNQALDAFLFAEADKRARGITLDLTLERIDTLSREVSEMNRRQADHERKDEDWHRGLSSRLDIVEAAQRTLVEDAAEAKRIAEAARLEGRQSHVDILESELEEARQEARRIASLHEQNRSRYSERLRSVEQTEKEERKWYQRKAIQWIGAVLLIVLGAAIPACVRLFGKALTP